MSSRTPAGRLVGPTAEKAVPSLPVFWSNPRLQLVTVRYGVAEVLVFFLSVISHAFGPDHPGFMEGRAALGGG
jgi:hypothetical protein